MHIAFYMSLVLLMLLRSPMFHGKIPSMFASQLIRGMQRREFAFHMRFDIFVREYKYKIMLAFKLSIQIMDKFHRCISRGKVLRTRPYLIFLLKILTLFCSRYVLCVDDAVTRHSGQHLLFCVLLPMISLSFIYRKMNALNVT